MLLIPVFTMNKGEDNYKVNVLLLVFTGKMSVGSCKKTSKIWQEILHCILKPGPDTCVIKYTCLKMFNTRHSWKEKIRSAFCKEKHFILIQFSDVALKTVIKVKTSNA